jgi:hypothetical protein
MVDPAAPRPLPQIEVDASMVAQALGLPLDEFRQLMDCGRIRTPARVKIVVASVMQPIAVWL